MASLKKTKSRLEPLMISLYWSWYIISFSDKNSKLGTWKGDDQMMVVALEM